MNLPALPSETALRVDQIDQYATTVEQFAAECSDVTEVAETRSRWAALTTYVKQRSKDGVARAEAAGRVLDIRVGELIIEGRERGEIHKRGGQGGVSESVHPSPLAIADLGLSRNEAARMLAMAGDPDTVAEVIAESDDASPPSRHKVDTAIRKKRAMGSDRVTRMRELAESGHTSRQIADDIGLGWNATRRALTAADIDVPADKLTAARRIDPARIVENMIVSLEALASTADLLTAEHFYQMSKPQRQEWAELLGPPLATITKLRKELKDYD